MDASSLTLLKVFYLTFSSFLTVVAQDYGLCADAFCSAPIGEGVTALHYPAIEPGHITFFPNQKFQIYVRDYGPKKNLLGVMINGQKGYIPKNLVREGATFNRNLVPATVQFLHANTNHVSSRTPVSTEWSHQETASSHGPNQVVTPNPNVNHQLKGQSHQPNSQIQFQNPQSSGQFQVGFGSETHTSSHIHSSRGEAISHHAESHQPPPHRSMNPHHGDRYQGQDHSHTHSTHAISHHAESHQPPPHHSMNTPQGGHYQGQVPDQSPIHSIHASFTQENPHQPNNLFQSSISSQLHQYASPNQYGRGASPSSFGQSTYASGVHTHAMESQPINYQPSLTGSEQFSNEQSRPVHQSSSHTALGNSKQFSIDNTRDILKKHGFDMDKLEAVEDSYFYSNQNPQKQADSSVFGFADQQSSHSGYSSDHFGDESYYHNPSEDYKSQSAIANDRNINSEGTGTAKDVLEDTSAHKASSRGDAMGSITIAPPEKSNKGVENVQHHNNEAKNDETALVLETPKTEKKNISIEKKSKHEGVETPENVAGPGSESSTLKPEVQSIANEGASSNANDSANSLSSSLNTSFEGENRKTQESTNLFSDSNTNNFVEKFEKGNLESSTDESSEFDFRNSSEMADMNDIKENFSQPAVSESSTDHESSSLTGGISELPAGNESVPVEDSIGSPLDTNELIESDTGPISFDSSSEVLDREKVNDSESLLEKEQKTDLEKLLNISDSNEIENAAYLNQYQVRNLKADQDDKNNQNLESLEEVEDNGTYLEFDFYSSFENSFEAVRSFIEMLLQWVPEPLFSILMDLEDMGISPRVPVFTALSAVPCVLLIVAVVCIKEKSKEKKLIAKLALSEKNVYTLSAEKTILEEKLDKAEVELETSATVLKDERKTYEELNAEIGSLKQYLEKANSELESSIEEIETLREREKQYIELVADHEKAYAELLEEKNQLECKLTNKEDNISRMNDELHEKETELKDLQDEKLNYLKSNAVYEEKISQLQQNCNQLLKEAEVWNIRVNELNTKLNTETSAKQELEKSHEVKNNEIESLTNLVQTFKSFEEFENAEGDENKTNEVKLKCLMDSSSTLIKLQNQEEENRLLLEKLSGEKTKILDMEVELLEAKSENEKLRINYNQALQNKAEAQTKLDVLTNYFKDKEIQLQKQLGVQEAFRERREKDADSAERRICLIEQENTSYKYQVASMKQEMEETERNLKNQIAVQEKKAHENWIAARAAERKLEDMKQEVTQLRQRLTLLEREQENWVNSSRDDVIRPIPKRIAGGNDESVNSQDINSSMDVRHNMFHPPLPMMLPPDRPLPPLPPPPPHMPPFLPPMDPHFRPQPWHLPPDPMGGSEFRITPPDFNRGRESTPPRGRHSVITDGEMGPLQSSPLGAEMRDSRNSTPPHSLPDFHDIPPPPRPFFPPPPGHHPRYPLPPPFRRDFAQASKRTDNQSDNSSSGRGTHPSSVPQDNWSHSNSRV